MNRNTLRNSLTLLFLLVLGIKFLFPLFMQPLQKKRDQLAAETSRLDELQSRVGTLVRYASVIKSFADEGLPGNSSVAAIRYQEWLRDCCDQSRVPDPIITLQEPAAEEGIGAKIDASIRGAAPLDRIGELVDRLSAAPIAHRLNLIKFQEVDPNSDRVTFEISTTAISFQTNNHTDLEHFPKSVGVRGFGKFLEERRCFCRYVPHVPLREIANEEPALLEAPNKSPIQQVVPHDALASTRLVGIVNQDGVARAWFHDSSNQLDIVVEQHRELQVDQFRAMVEGIGTSEVKMRQGFNELSVSLGQSIRQSLDSIVRP